jgi:hypothetical protein
MIEIQNITVQFEEKQVFNNFSGIKKIGDSTQA